jgi:glutamine synthetase
MGDMLTRLIEDIISGKPRKTGAEQQLIDLGVNRLPEIEKDNTDRNRTSPFAFTGAKFEFRAVGSSQSIAFPVMLVNAAVAEAIGEITQQIKAETKKTKSVEDAVLNVVREAFRETKAVRFEGNGYSEDWVKEADKRGLLNLRRTPEALEQLVTKQSRTLFTKLGILSKEELESRFHVRLERYAKDILIELHTCLQLIDTMVLPSSFTYLNSLAEGAARAKAAGLKSVPQMGAAERVGALVTELQTTRDALAAAVEKAEGMHDDAEKQARFLTSTAADAMAAARAASDALENVVSDDLWPLPKYREMLFPV